MLNGLHCLSRFLADINSRTHYEGRHVFAIYSRNDDKVGYFVCNKVGSAIRGADDSFEESDMDHGAVIMKTVRKQFSLVTKHKAS
ncbi:unnamed protein product [Gongylonema pulchrum]|uniref:F-box only protein 22 n=1 Tax=Gongylonema pulchrum TaxID=637853 RepID=A0A183DW98_9BILA|nr:unnamed protein product [Gongylonema pulchrum]